MLMMMLLLLLPLVALTGTGTSVCNRLNGGCHNGGQHLAVQARAPPLGRLLTAGVLVAGADQYGGRWGRRHLVLIVVGEHGGCRRGRLQLNGP